MNQLFIIRNNNDPVYERLGPPNWRRQAGELWIVLTKGAFSCSMGERAGDLAPQEPLRNARHHVMD
ncbi:hypothetical protein ACTMTF_40155 [Nonomuraea sp. ZG12]|uniref:hypothetical protein n=1 Tax=Nonomuraea sp. ZG12 TaxID=3452207 RepID=UPI003F891FB4